MIFRTLTLGMALVLLALPLGAVARDSAAAQPDPRSASAQDTGAMPDDADSAAAPDTGSMSAGTDSTSPQDTDTAAQAEAAAPSAPAAPAPPTSMGPAKTVQSVGRHAPITTMATPPPK